MVEVRNNGVPLIVQAPRAGITHAIRDLASKLEGVNQRTGKDGDAVAKGGESKWRKFWPGGKSS
jgi:pilus assembly protein CpaE